MGVRVLYHLYGESATLQAAEELIAKSLEELENSLSDYRRDSEINRLCRNALPDTEQTVSEPLWELCRRSLELSERTAGAFDVTVGPVSHLWRSAIKRQRLPRQDQIAAALESVGYRKLQVLPDQRIKLLASNMQLDFGGIAKGYAADTILARLKKLGITAALLDVGGDVTVCGVPPGRDSWRVQLDDPAGARPLILRLKAGSVATSGDTVQRLVVEGIPYSHMIDPRTGQATTTSHCTTVIASDGATADALATAFSVLPLSDIAAHAAQFEGIAYRIVRRASAASPELQIIASPNFHQYISDD